ncbi:MAG: hypothetical protein IIC91_05475 [Chloroflexi bacterium]|nr:hypothetical protein [Chloroflexota bacterium]
MSELPTERTLRRLARFRSVRAGVLSLYLTFGPTARGKRRNVRSAVDVAFDRLSKSQLTERQRAGLERERTNVHRLLGRRFRPSGRSMILFACEPRGLWELFQLQVPSLSIARFGERPAVSQLASILDEQERYGVLILDKERARLLSVYLGEVEDEITFKGRYSGRTAAGGWSQARYERRREGQLHTHVMKAIDALAREQRARGFDRILIGGPDEALAALLGALPRGLRSRVSGTFSCELSASNETILKRTRPLMEAAERNGEEIVVGHLLSAAKSGGLATLGWEETLPALLEGRVHKLVLVDRLRKRGRSCAGGHIAAGRASACSRCQEAVGVSHDLTEAAVGAALDTQASVEMVRGPAAQRLRSEGGIGAILRY